MQWVDIPGTDLRMSRLVLGTMTFGSQTDEDAARAMIDTAVAAGINALDTANAYNGGVAEEIIGRLISGRRSDFVLATKVGMPHPDAGADAALHPRAVRACLIGSLRRLGTDYVDIYYLHQPDRSIPIADTLGALRDLTREGLIRTAGVSNYAAWQIAQMRDPAPRVSQPMYNLLARRIEDEYVEFAAEAGIRNIVYNPLAGGLLTGKHRFDRPTGRFGGPGMGEMYRGRYWQPGFFAAVEKLQRIATEAGITLPQLAFRWLLSRPATDAVLLGSSRIEHLTGNIADCQESHIAPEVAAACDEIWKELRGPAPNYNR